MFFFTPLFIAILCYYPIPTNVAMSSPSRIYWVSLVGRRVTSRGWPEWDITCVPIRTPLSWKPETWPWLFSGRLQHAFPDRLLDWAKNLVRISFPPLLRTTRCWCEVNGASPRKVGPKPHRTSSGVGGSNWNSDDSSLPQSLYSVHSIILFSSIPLQMGRLREMSFAAGR